MVGDSGAAAIVPGDLSASELVRRIRATDPDERMPPGGAALADDQIKTLESWISSGAIWPAPPVTQEDVAAAPLISDAEFLRRSYLDTVGVPPTEQEAREYLHDESVDKRTKLVDRLLADERYADNWVSYWQDVLAENPTLVNSSLNTTGPFRWFLYDSLRDNKSFDRMVSELIQLRGSAHEGGSAGFGIAGDNDAPYAAKGQIVANAFLGSNCNARGVTIRHITARSKAICILSRRCLSRSRSVFPKPVACRSRSSKRRLANP
jgi:hypothetical protein